MSRRFSFDTSTPTAIPGWYDSDVGVEKYNVTGLLAHGDISEVYEGTGINNEPILIKVCRSTDNNDLLENEFSVLTAVRTSRHWIKAGEAKFPLPRESFFISKSDKPRRAIVFAKTPMNGKPALENPVTLTEVNIAFPQLDPRDAAWMFNRLIDSLHCLHVTGYVHGAVTPDHLLIEPKGHRGQLIDFSYAVKEGDMIKAISPQWAGLYAPEVHDRLPATPATDIYMAARCMFFLLGLPTGQKPLGATIDDLMPTPMFQLLRACTLGQGQRIQTAQQVHEDFRDVLTSVYGPRTFRVFEMPVATAPETA